MKKMMAGILGLLLAVGASGGYTPLAYLEATGSQWIHTGAWVAFMLDENIRGVILMRRWHTKGWVGKSLS